eukprot:3874093-Pleurochrysis_carterae.AAC.1
MGQMRLLCFDDRTWESYSVDVLKERAKLLTHAIEGKDDQGKRIAAVLLEKGANTQTQKAPAGF